MRRALFLLVCLSLGGCTATEQNFHKAHDVFKRNQQRANDSLLAFFGPADPLTPPPPPVKPTFCYRANTDILCYHQPLPGQDSRLIAKQPPGVGETSVDSQVLQGEPAFVPVVTSRELGNPMGNNFPEHIADQPVAVSGSGPKQLLKNF